MRRGRGEVGSEAWPPPLSPGVDGPVWILIFFDKIGIISVGKLIIRWLFSLTGSVSQFTGHGISLTEVLIGY